MVQTQDYELTQMGSVLGEENVTLSPNQTSPQRETTVISFTGPRQFEEIDYQGRRDATRFVPRTTETLDGTAADDTVVSLEANIQPVAGETKLSEQDYPVVVAYNVTQGAEIDIASIDYAANEVTLASDPADGDSVKLWPIMSEGTVQYRIVNQLGQVEDYLYPWATPLYKWHDFPQLQRGREVNLQGGGSWKENEHLELVMDAPQAITWEDADYPHGAYVSTIEQEVEITL